MNRRQKQLLHNAKVLIVGVLVVFIVVGIIVTGSEGRSSKKEDSCSENTHFVEKAEMSKPLTEPTENREIEMQFDSTETTLVLSAKERYLLAKIAMAEAEGENTKGKALVIMVVLNRVWNENFPNTIEKVIYQEKQFSPISDGRWEKVEPDADCWKALQMIQEDCWDESQGALYFESNSESDWHRNNLKYLFKHGNHYFYTDKE